MMMKMAAMTLLDFIECGRGGESITSIMDWLANELHNR